jgi:hypothetical protein
MIFTGYWPRGTVGGGGSYLGISSLGRYCPSPLAFQMLSTWPEDLARREIECDLDELTGAHVFEVLLEVGREQVTVGACDQGGDSADTQDACHHARAHLEVDDEAVLGCPQRRVLEVELRLLQLRLDVGDACVDAIDFGFVRKRHKLFFGA